MKYPFTPEVLDILPEELAELFRSLEDTLIEEIASRLKAAGQLNEVTAQDMRALRSHGIDLDGIKKAVSKAAGIAEKDLDALLADVVERNQAYYTELIDAAKVTAPEALVDGRDVDAIVRQTKESLHNITQSMAFVVGKGDGVEMLPPTRAYQWALDNAELQVMSGAVSYGDAIKKAVKSLASSGIRFAEYESGHRDHIDVAARRAVMTGVNQLCQRYAEQSVEYLGTDLVEVSAHGGARDTGDGPANHKAWQGKVYRWKQKKGNSKGNYPDFIESTGYGTGEGLGGWNCRHHFYPFYEGVSERTYTDAQLDKIDPPAFEFEGKKYTRYAATQKQREIERTVRKLTRQQTAAKALGDDDEAAAAGAVIRRLKTKYNAFSKAAELPTQEERMKVIY